MRHVDRLICTSYTTNIANMMKISKSGKSTPSFTPNLLPCKIHQDGSINASSRYWSPKPGKDGKPEAYFRGRKLKGREVKLPDGYRGVIVKATRSIEKEAIPPLEIEEEEEGEDFKEVTVLEEIGSFDEVMAWGHECSVDDGDEFVRGIDEWLKFSQTMHESGPEGKNTR